MPDPGGEGEAAAVQIAKMMGATVIATAEEVEHLEAAIESLLAPYVLRKSDAAQVTGARSVRMLRYVLPEAQP